MKKWWLIKWWRLQFWLIKWQPILSRLTELRVLLVFIMIACGLGAYIWNFHAHEISKNPESWAHFGDYLGGIFSFFSFMALLYTVHLQIQELKATKEELKLSRQAQQESAEAQEQSAEVLRKQQFENTFFQLLNQVTLHLNKLTSTTTDDVSTINSLYSQLEKYDFYDYKPYMNLNDLKKEHDRLKEYSNLSFYSKIEKFQKNCHNEKPEFPQFCLIVYQLLKLIRNSPYSHNKAEATKEERQYSNFLRAILPPEILQLMALYCYRQEQESSFKPYQELIERYALFEHMPFHHLGDGAKREDTQKNNLELYSSQRYFYLFIYIYYKYDRSAFGENETLKETESELKKISIE